jgi:hypothetical protein
MFNVGSCMIIARVVKRRGRAPSCHAAASLTKQKQQTLSSACMEKCEILDHARRNCQSLRLRTASPDHAHLFQVTRLTRPL